MAIINPSHRQAILGKASSGGGGGASGGDDFGLDFDAVLGDLTSAIADLESISVVSWVSNNKINCKKNIDILFRMLTAADQSHFNLN